jgi:phenylalanyl-tRNA synthetase beta chain
MKVSESWLREWVNPSITGEQLIAQLTMAGIEVDARNQVAGDFNNVIVAHVLQTSAHPQADRLTLCEVSTGTKTLKIVCGAANVRPNLKVALALPGANLPGGILIKESMLRGQPSQGMLCSAVELGLEERSDGILELPDDAPVGTDVRDYLSLNDHVLDVDLTPNRADCFSTLGIAREIAALNHLALKPLPNDVMQPEIDDNLVVHLVAPEQCPQYYGRVIRNINPDATTPLWMKERLRRSGIRSLHPVVDVTNYVMLELGQPMHAFDLQAIDGSIDVRNAHPQEELVLLNGQKVILDKQVLVIADRSKALGLAGIMGGEASSVQEKTTDIFLESAFFNPLVIAGVARRYGLCSDSSQRFERGVDPTLQIRALERATHLLTSIAGGKVGPVTCVNQPEFLPKQVAVLFKPDKVKQLTGVDVPQERMISILESLGMSVTSGQDQWRIAVPTYRFDITLEVDLVEEVVRLFGYDNLVAEPILTSMQAGTVNAYEQLSIQMSAHLKSRGYHETISYSFVDPQLQEALYPSVESLQIVNPISSELSHMRVSLWPGLLASMIYNIHRQQTAVKFFESGVVFDLQGSSLQERACLAGLLIGEQGRFNWCETTRAIDFYDLKGDLQSLFAALKLQDVQFIAAEHSALHPGQSARILINGQNAGWIGVLHPRLLDALDLTDDVVLFELSLSVLLNRKLDFYRPISKYPQTRRDLSFIVEQTVTAEQLEQAVREAIDSEMLKTFDIFDVYMGESIPAGKKSLGLTLTLQNDNRTLIDTEINTIIGDIIKKLEDAFSVTLRMDVV